MFKEIKFEELEKITNGLSNEFSSKFRLVEKWDVISECCIFYSKFHANYIKRYEEYQGKDKEYKKNNPISDWATMFRKSYDWYCRKHLAVALFSVCQWSSVRTSSQKAEKNDPQ